MKFWLTFLLVNATCFLCTSETTRGQVVDSNPFSSKLERTNDSPTARTGDSSLFNLISLTSVNGQEIRIKTRSGDIRVNFAATFEVHAFKFGEDYEFTYNVRTWRQLPVDRDGDGALDTEIHDEYTDSGTVRGSGHGSTFLSYGRPGGEALPGTYITRVTLTFDCAETRVVDSARLVVPTIIGDLNFDGIVNFRDITLFTGILSTGDFQSEADINQDGFVDFRDIVPFIRLLN